jgi:hypothetical protein
MARITKMPIHRFGGREVLQADDVEPSLPDTGKCSVRAVSVNPVDFKIRSRQVSGREGRPRAVHIGPGLFRELWKSAAPRGLGSNPATRCLAW